MNFKNVNKVSKSISLSNQLDALLAGRKFEELNCDEQNLYKMLQAEIEYLQAKCNGNFKTRRDKKRQLKYAQKQYKVGLFLNKFTAPELDELAHQNSLRYTKRVELYSLVGLLSFVSTLVFALLTLVNFPAWILLITASPIVLFGLANIIDTYVSEHICKKLKLFAEFKQQKNADNKIEENVNLLTDKEKVELVANMYESVPDNKRYEIKNLIKHMINQNMAKKHQTYADFEAEQTHMDIPTDINEDTQLSVENINENTL